MVLGVNAAAGDRGLLWQAGLSALQTQQPSERRSRARTAHDARDGLPRTPSGLYALDLRGGSEPTVAASTNTWFAELTGITRFFDVVVTDWGARSWRVDLGQVVSASHAVCVVARADRYAAEEAAALVPALLAAPDSPRVVLALVDVGGTAVRSIETLRDALGIPVFAVPYDPSRAALAPASSVTLAARTRIAYTRIATSLMMQPQVVAEKGVAAEVIAR
jgi:hypothetical protein